MGEGFSVTRSPRSQINFDYCPETRLVYGKGASARIGELARELGAGRVLLVTDPGIVAAGHAEQVVKTLEACGLVLTIFDEVHENPTTCDVDHCVKVAAAADIDTIVGLGGGSSLDTAKGCNFLLTNGGRMQDYWGVGKAAKPMLPLIAVPTTAGTGSECQSFALIADETSHQKMACGDPKAAARIAILDPMLTLTQPCTVAACTGLDAVTHAVEAAVTTRRNPLSQLFAIEAFRLTHVALAGVLSQPDDIEARSCMQLGAAYAGIAIENAMLGAAHSASNPLTARHGVVHGAAVGMMLPHVVRFNAESSVTRQNYADLVRRVGLSETGADDQAAIDSLLDCLGNLLRAAAVPRSLEEYGVPRSALPDLAEEAARQWTARFNPRSITEGDFLGLYERAFAK